MTPQQRYGLGSAPATQGGLSQKRKTKAITVSGKPKKFADGGKVKGYADGGEVDQDTIDNMNSSYEEMGQRDDAARRLARHAGAKKADFEGGGNKVERQDSGESAKDVLHRTVNGAPIRNPRPANIPTVSGVVRG